MTRVLLTGANGFVGTALLSSLQQAGFGIRAAVRKEGLLPPNVPTTVVGDIGAGTFWDRALDGIDVVIHLAGRAHVLHKNLAGDRAFMEINGLGTKTLADASAAAGVRRFIYLSSIKVNGEETGAVPFNAADTPRPQDGYGLSKLVGERHVLAAGARSDMEVSIVRPPLIYGPGVRANFRQMMQWVSRGWPLPLGSVRNARSLVSIWNLTDLLVRVIDHPAAAGRTLFVSDGQDLSTPELLCLIGRSLGKPARLVPVPLSVLRLGARAIGATAQLGKLCGSLQVDISATRQQLNWAPPVSVEDSMARTAAAYLSSGGMV